MQDANVVVPFREYQANLATSMWARRPNTQRWLQASGVIKDGIAQGATLATAAHLTNFAPYDALPLLGAERGIARAPGESEAAYREQLRRYLSTHKAAGTPGAIKAIFNRLGMPNHVLLKNSEYDAGDGHFGPGPEYYWARLWIELSVPHVFTPPEVWGGLATWGAGSKWGFEESVPGTWRFIKSELLKWKPSHVQIVAVKIIFADLSFVWASVER